MSGIEKPFTVIESPFSGTSTKDVVRNVQYAMLAVRDSLERGEAPYASHLFFTQMLDDNDAAERQLGIDSGLAICRHSDQTAVYTDLGISGGMQYGIDTARKSGRAVIERRLFQAIASLEEIESMIDAEYNRHNLPNAATIASIYGRIIK